jgi:hypothetical protein
MQHTNHRVSGRSVADETAATDLLLGQPEGFDVGALEARLDVASNEEFYERHFGDGGRSFVAACRNLLENAPEESLLVRLIRERGEGTEPVRNFVYEA